MTVGPQTNAFTQFLKIGQVSHPQTVDGLQHQIAVADQPIDTGEGALYAPFRVVRELRKR